MSRPFDEARYRVLLEGLEVSEISLSVLENGATIGAEYYAPEFLRPYNQLAQSRLPLQPLKQICALLTDGDHGSAEYADEGVPFVLSEAVNEGWINRSACRSITAEHAASLPRSTLVEGDVLVSKTGVYFGKSAVVPKELAGANTIAHVGVLRLKASHDPYFVSTFLNSRYGYTQLRRRGIKATRPEIKLIEFADVCVPTVSRALSQKIREVIVLADKVRARGGACIAAAELALLAGLGLDKRRPDDPLACTSTSRNAFDAGRLDAEYFAPRVSDLLQRLRRDGSTIGGVAPPRHERFVPGSEGKFQYIEIGGVGADGTARAETVMQDEAPSRATWRVRSGDVITSMVRPVRRLSALVPPAQDGCVCSSGFVVLQPVAITTEVLLTYLRLPPICELMDLHTSASLYPAISEADLLALPVPRIDATTQAAVAAAVRTAQASRLRAATLLGAAKRAVEIAIEDSERSALAWLADALRLP